MPRIEYATYNQELISKVDSIVDDWKAGKKVFEIQTSGSTGKPKILELHRMNMENSARMTLNALQIKKGQTALLCLSPDTIGGLMMIIRSIVGDLKLIVVEATRNPLKDIDNKIDFCAMVPLQVYTTLNDAKEKLNLVEHLIIGGASLKPKSINSLSPLRTRVYQTFGMTETISHIALKSLNHQNSNYKLLPGIEIETTAENQLVITSHALGIQKLITNDIVSIVSADEFVWLGRADFVINSAGVKIHPEHVESKLSGHIPFPFYITSEFSEEFGETVVLVINAMNCNNLPKKEFFVPLLEKYEIPKKIKFGIEFNYTENGKLDRITTNKKLSDAEERVL